MESATAPMDISVEYNDEIEAYAASMGDKYEYHIKEVDFGIVERPRQKVDIIKAVTGIKVTLANGQVIVDATVNPEDGKLSGQTKGLTYGPSANGALGFLKVEIDNEIMQGATVQIEYTLKVKNNGEVDYATERYYKYGEAGGDNDIVRMKPDVYDYLDSEMELDKTNNDDEWKEVEKQDYTNTRINYQKYNTNEEVKNTITETYYKSYTPGNGVSMWEFGGTTYRELFTQWKSKIDTIITTRKVRDAKLYTRKILNTAKAGGLEDVVKPTEERSVKLYATRLLVNTNEIDLNNDAEITEVKRISRGETGTLPKILTSQFYDRGESVTLTPPTGQNKNYRTPIIIGVTSLIIIGVGVIIIKKKVI